MVIDGTTAGYRDLPRRTWIRSDDGYRTAGPGHQAMDLTKKTSGLRRPRQRAFTRLQQDDEENWPPSEATPASPPAKKPRLDVLPGHTAGESWIPPKEQEPPHVGMPPSCESWLPETRLVPFHVGITPSFDYRIPQVDQDLPRLSTAPLNGYWFPLREQEPSQGIKPYIKDFWIPPGMSTLPLSNNLLPLTKQDVDSAIMKTSGFPHYLHTTTTHQENEDDRSPPTELLAKRRVLINDPGHTAGGRGRPKSCTYEARTATSDPFPPTEEQDSSLINTMPSSDSWLQQEPNPPHQFAIPSCDFWLPPEEGAHHHVGTLPSTETWLPLNAQENPRRDTQPTFDPCLTLEKDHHHSGTLLSTESGIPQKDQVLPYVGTSHSSDAWPPPAEQNLPRMGISLSCGSCLPQMEEVPPRRMTETSPHPDTLQETAIYSLTQEPVTEGPVSSPVSLKDEPSVSRGPLLGAPFVHPVTSAVSCSGIQEQPSQVSEALSTTEAIPNIPGCVGDHILDLSSSFEQRKADRISSSSIPRDRPQHPCTRDHLPVDYSLDASPNLTALDYLNHHKPGILQPLYPVQGENTNPRPGVAQPELFNLRYIFLDPPPFIPILPGKDNLQKPTDTEAMVYRSACQTNKEGTGIQDQTHPIGEPMSQAKPDSETSPTPVPASSHELLTMSQGRETQSSSYGVGSCPESCETFHDMCDVTRDYLELKQVEHRCKTCGTTCRDISHLQDHEKMHRNRMYACSFCKKTFTSKKMRATHIISTVCQRVSRYLRHTENGWECIHCEHFFDTRKKAEDHAIQHERGKGYNCPVCDEHFERKDNLLYHARSCHYDYYKSLYT
ncbi:uncharacterized protein [Panulirus ornatus]|uniref:uncharacterized protein n=1 Tax=Panulirus ornatus TaxID=150431 RepID=UPI003A8C7BF9